MRGLQSLFPQAKRFGKLERSFSVHDKAELHDDALIEFVEATAWYAERDADIAEDFAREVEGSKAHCKCDADPVTGRTADSASPTDAGSSPPSAITP